MHPEKILNAILKANERNKDDAKGRKLSISYLTAFVNNEKLCENAPHVRLYALIDLSKYLLRNREIQKAGRFVEVARSICQRAAALLPTLLILEYYNVAAETALALREWPGLEETIKNGEMFCMEKLQEGKSRNIMSYLCGFAVLKVRRYLMKNDLDNAHLTIHQIIDSPYKNKLQEIFFILLDIQLTLLSRPKDALLQLSECTDLLNKVTDREPSMYLRILWCYCSVLHLTCHFRLGTTKPTSKKRQEKLEYFFRVIKEYKTNCTAIYQPGSSMRFFHWMQEGALMALKHLFQAQLAKYNSNVSGAHSNLTECINILVSKDVNSSPSIDLVFFYAKASMVKLCLIQEKWVEGAQMILEMIELHKKTPPGLLPFKDLNLRAILIHCLCSHLCLRLGMNVQAKNHCKRMYRLTTNNGDFSTVRIFSRLQLVILRVAGGQELAAADLKKSRAELERYSATVRDENRPLLHMCSLLADGTLCLLEGKNEEAKEVLTEALSFGGKSCTMNIFSSLCLMSAAWIAWNKSATPQDQDWEKPTNALKMALNTAKEFGNIEDQIEVIGLMKSTNITAAERENFEADLRRLEVKRSHLLDEFNTEDIQNVFGFRA